MESYLSTVYTDRIPIKCHLIIVESTLAWFDWVSYKLFLDFWN